MNKEEIEQHRDDMNVDDAQVLRVLLHNIKGISPVSTNPTFMPLDLDETPEE